jgi:hypothetical protein
LILVISYICRKDNASSEAAATSKKLPKKWMCKLFWKTPDLRLRESGVKHFYIST